MIGVQFPPIEAGRVGAAASNCRGRPFPLNRSEPRYGVGRRTGRFAGVILAVQRVSFPADPYAGSKANAWRTVGDVATVGISRGGSPSRIPMKNMRSRRCGVSYRDALRMKRLVR